MSDAPGIPFGLDVRVNDATEDVRVEVGCWLGHELVRRANELRAKNSNRGEGSNRFFAPIPYRP
jgi:hypothetical protein